MRLALGLSALIVLLGACGGPRAGGPWSTAVAQAHTLVGRIWDVRAERFIGEDVLSDRLRASRFVLLGEQHDNADHHRLQAHLARRIYAGGRRPALALEMITPAQGAALVRHLSAYPHDAAGLGAALGWAHSGWPPWAQYAPIVQAALDAEAPVVPANLDRATARAVARGGRVPTDLVTRFQLDRPLDEGGAGALAAEIRDAHCGALSEGTIAGLVNAQRARDAAMATAMLDVATDGAILVAGAGHVRTDRGVPALVAAAAPGVARMAVAFVEVADGWTAPAAYAERFGTDRLPFDVVWFTPRASNDDPCATLRRPGP